MTVEVLELFDTFYKEHEGLGKTIFYDHMYAPVVGFPLETDYFFEFDKEGNAQVKKKDSGVMTYINRVFYEVYHRHVENTDIFPNEDEEYRKDFMKYIKEYTTLLYRVLAIMVSNEHESVYFLKKNLITTLQKVVCFAQFYKLIDETEYKCISFMVDPILKEYNLDYEDIQDESQEE